MGYQRRVFTTYTTETIESVFRDLLRDSTYGARFSVRFDNLPPGAVDVEFLAGRWVRITAPFGFPNEERRDFFTNRLLSTWRLLATTRFMFEALRGRCRLWLDDHPDGAGLAFCGNSTSHVLIPDSSYLECAGYRTLNATALQTWRPWHDREKVVFWRGSSTGNRALLKVSDWRSIPRFKMALLARSVNRSDLFDVGISNVVQVWDAQELADIAASGIVKDVRPQLDLLNYRHSVDLDGNTSSWPGLFSKLAMGVAVLKVDSPLGYRQWYYDKLVPWKNYIPVRADFSDLVEVSEWAQSHPEIVACIAENGTELARSLGLFATLEQSASVIRDYVANMPDTLPR